MNITLGIQVQNSFHSEIDYNNFNLLSFAAFNAYVNSPLEVIGLLIWAFVTWKGTKPLVYFSKHNAILLGTIGFLILSTNLYCIITAWTEETSAANEAFIIMVINMTNQIYVYSKYFITYSMIINGKDVNEFIIDHI